MSGYFARLAAQIDARVETAPPARAIKPLEQQVEAPVPNNVDTTAVRAAMSSASAVLFPAAAQDAHGVPGSHVPPPATLPARQRALSAPAMAGAPSPEAVRLPTSSLRHDALAVALAGVTLARGTDARLSSPPSLLSRQRVAQHPSDRAANPNSPQVDAAIPPDPGSMLAQPGVQRAPGMPFAATEPPRSKAMSSREPATQLTPPSTSVRQVTPLPRVDVTRLEQSATATAAIDAAPATRNEIRIGTIALAVRTSEPTPAAVPQPVFVAIPAPRFSLQRHYLRWT
ncbi:hypothetical protein [Candidatus Accumulibacter phosphatis]|nr:hypothetical protein [Candidatus Accumulibacter phosphatis]